MHHRDWASGPRNFRRAEWFGVQDPSDRAWCPERAACRRSGLGSGVRESPLSFSTGRPPQRIRRYGYKLETTAHRRISRARDLPLDPIDFETRYWVPYSGWPITFDHMIPYYDRARKLCGIEPFDFHGPLPQTGPAPLSSPSGTLVTRLEQFGPASVFTTQPLAELTRSDQLHLVTNASAVELISAEGTDDGMATTSVRTSGGGSFSVRSRVVVLAGGALENARILLNSRAQCSTGLETSSTTSADSSWSTLGFSSVAARTLDSGPRAV